ncbi:Mu transposase C-terminal domain-containing protein [Serratia fonticola]
MSEQHNHRDTEGAFEPQRVMIAVKIDELVCHNDGVFRIVQVVDFGTVVGVHLETGRHASLRIAELRPLEGAEAVFHANATDIEDIADEDWKIAQRRFAAIQPFLGQMVSGREEVKRRAQEVGVNAATLYRWLQRFNSYGTVSALIPMKRGWSTGKSRLSAEMESIIEDALQNFYLTRQRNSASKTIEHIYEVCRRRGIEPPNHMSVRARIARLPEKSVLRGRGFIEKAHNLFYPTPGSFPSADYPLSVVQIDHTPADVILVDDVYRKPIGRPWLTLAIDVYSRMVTGYYISFDAPSETSVAMCVAHSMLPKEEWLMLHETDAEWPVWGKPTTIHVDNGPDFRSDNFRKSCMAYGINLEFRPVKTPRYGGHIERLLGTVLRRVHGLPGTTFSSIKDRVEYDSDNNAVMTKSDFESWFLTYITKVYHQKLHSGIGLSPIKKWGLGIFGNAETPGAGLPPRPADRMTLQLDFMSSVTRTIQPFGVTWNDMKYYAEPIRSWINATDKATGKKRSFLFRYDPRDISSIWFFDPALKAYFRIPFADLSRPSMSLWEYKQVRQKLKSEGINSVNQHTIDAGLAEMRQKVEEASLTTRKARRQVQRRKEHESGVTPASPISKGRERSSVNKSAAEASDYIDGLIKGDIDPFGDFA